MSSERIVLVDGARTPVGSFGAVFKDVPAHEVGAVAARGALGRSGVPGDEVVPVDVPGPRARTVTEDEHPRPDTTLEILSGLRPAFAEGGTVTAGNASGINDGAAAVVLATESAVGERGLTPMVALEAVTTAAMEPELMGYAPVLALRALVEKAGVGPADLDVVECNEAFASQAVAVIRDAGLDADTVNPYGGAIVLGASRRCHRSDPGVAPGEAPAPQRRRARRGDDVRRRRVGPGRVVQAGLTMAGSWIRLPGAVCVSVVETARTPSSEKEIR